MLWKVGGELQSGWCGQGLGPGTPGPLPCPVCWLLHAPGTGVCLPSAGREPGEGPANAICFQGAECTVERCAFLAALYKLQLSRYLRSTS